jgi:hypothetical protein
MHSQPALKDRKFCEENDDDSVTPTDWLKQTDKLHPLLDISFGKGACMHFATADFRIQFKNFYSG